MNTVARDVTTLMELSILFFLHLKSHPKNIQKNTNRRHAAVFFFFALKNTPQKKNVLNALFLFFFFLWDLLTKAHGVMSALVVVVERRSFFSTMRVRRDGGFGCLLGRKLKHWQSSNINIGQKPK